MATAVLTECQILAMQFVLVRPISSILTFVVDVVLSQQNENSTSDTDDGGNSAYTSYFKSPNFYIAMITNVSVFFAFQGLLKFYHAVHLDLKWCQPFNKFLSIKSIVFLTFWQGLLIAILISVNDNSSYHHESISTGPNATTIGQAGSSPTFSPMYPIPAPTNYEPIAVTPQPYLSKTNDITKVPTTTANANNMTRFLDDPNPTPSSNNDADDVHDSSGNNAGTNDDIPNEDDNENNEENNTKENNGKRHPSNKERASQIQNFLICFEMLLFAIGHWCVFPAEEWKPDYRPPMNSAKPGFGISDFAQDISDIVGNATQRHRRRRRKDYERTDTESIPPPVPTADDDDDDVDDEHNEDDDRLNGSIDHPPNTVVMDEYHDNDNNDGDLPNSHQLRAIT
jgi:hypothetical protein